MLKEKTIEELEELTIPDLSQELFDSIDNGYLTRKYLKTLMFCGASLEDRDIFFIAPIHIAVMNNHVEVIKVLIAAGADLEVTDNNCWTPLHQAVFHGHVEVVKTLIEAGADLEVRGSYGETVLHHALSFENCNMINILLAAGANIYAKTVNGNPISSIAICSNSSKIGALFLITLEEYSRKGWDYPEINAKT